MGNSIGRLCSGLCGSWYGEDHKDVHASAAVSQTASLGPHGITVETVGLAALARDLFQFEITGEVPMGLGKYVQSSTAAQLIWYGKLLAAWKASQPLPSNVQEASQLVIQTLKGHQRINLRGFLSFYRLLPLPARTGDLPASAAVVFAPAALYPQELIQPRPLPEGVQYELHTLPVDQKSVVDGDTLVVYVDASDGTREAAAAPLAVHEAMAKRRLALKEHNLKIADSLNKEILKAGYKIMDASDENDEILAHKYRVRLRGVDAPENKMPYGQEAKAMLLTLVENQPLDLFVYNVDRYGRIVADIYCKGALVQEILLKSGYAWHYTAYDHRPEFAKWEEEARSAKKGLWAEENPEKPWEYRKYMLEYQTGSNPNCRH